MSSDWNKRRRSSGDDRRDDRDRPRQFRRREEGDQAPSHQNNRDSGPRRGGFPRDQRGGAPGTPGGGFQRDRGDQRGGTPGAGSRGDDRTQEAPQGWRPFDSPFPPERDQRGPSPRDQSGRSSFRDRERPAFRNERTDRPRQDEQGDEWSPRRRAERPWQRERDDEASPGRRSYGQEWPRDRERPFTGRGGERDQPYRRRDEGNRRDDPGNAPRGERGSRADERPSFGDRHGDTRRERFDRRPDAGQAAEADRGWAPRRQDERPSFERGGFRARQERGATSPFERIQADLYGRWPVMEALRAGHVEKIYLALGVNEAAEQMRDLLALAAELQIPVLRVERLALDRVVSGANHQGIAAATRPFNYASFDAVLEAARSSERLPLLLLFDSVQDPQNLGAILRTAEAAGAHGAVLGKHQQVGVTPAVMRASAGAAEHVPIAQVTNLRQSIERLKEAGYWILGLDMEGGTDYDNLDVESPIALIVGGEGHGVGRLVAEHCDYLVRLPMRGRVGSLNASVATGIVLYEIQRRRDEQRRRTARSRKTSAPDVAISDEAVAATRQRPDHPGGPPDEAVTQDIGSPANATAQPADSADRSPGDRAASHMERATEGYQEEPESLPAAVYDSVIEDLEDVQED